MTDKVEIVTERFLLRELTCKDVSVKYLCWLHDDDAKKYITASTSTRELSDLARYVREHIGRDDVVFLGIFDKEAGCHIGNVKYEPVDSALGRAVVGILIGEPGWRSKGVAGEALVASAGWLYKHRNIRQIALGVSRVNAAAIRAYQKVGFVEEPTDLIPAITPEGVSMVWHLDVEPSLS
ncbi:GNAT family N-acetyltransferase [Pseudomonadota bacterium]